MTNINLSIKGDDDLVTLVDALITDFSIFSEKASEWGYRIRPISEKSHGKLMTLSATDIHIIRNRFQKWADLYMAESRVKKKLSERQVVWRLLRELGLRPTGDLFNLIQDQDVIEVYGADGIQIFRNLRFFDFSTYSLSDIFTFDWQELFNRDPKIVDKINQILVEIFGKQARETTSPDLGWHDLEETFSEDKHRMEVEHRIISPLFNDTNQTTALIALTGARFKLAKNSESLQGGRNEISKNRTLSL